MTHLLDNQYRIIDLDGKVTQYGHVGMDPDPSRDEYYKKLTSTSADTAVRVRVAAFFARVFNGASRSADCVPHHRKAALHRRVSKSDRALRRESGTAADTPPVLARRRWRGSTTAARARLTKRCST